MRLLRQLARRKLRTTLTILGITIGIWALVVFSSMANKINALVEGGSQYFAGKVLVTDASNIGVGIGIAPMNIGVADAIRKVDGVAAAAPEVQMVYDPEAGAFGGSQTIVGFVAGSDEGHETFEIRALQALGWVGLVERGGHRPMELSGGEQQRVAIARSLVNEPMLLLADEPTGNLDTARSVEVLQTLRRFNAERGQTVVLVTHDSELGETCDRIIHTRDGLVEGVEQRSA